MPNFKFIPISENKLFLLHEWLQQSHIREFWEDGDRTLEQVKEHYFCKDGVSRFFILLSNDMSIGYIQSYPITEESEFNDYINTNQSAMGIDFFIGNKQFLEKGFAAKILTEFMQRQVNITTFIVDPEVSNVKAIHIYKKLGFTAIADFKSNNKDYKIMSFSKDKSLS